MNKRRSKFSPEFKQEAVDLVKRSAKSANQIAKELGISQTSLSRWLRQADATPTEENVFSTQEELRRLKKEVERLRMERDILKNVWSAPGLQGLDRPLAATRLRQCIRPIGGARCVQ